jgi:hypothetical protein
MLTETVGQKRLRRALDAFAARLPEDAEITDGLKQRALDAFLYAFAMAALAAEYRRAAAYALRGIECEKAGGRGEG